MPSMQKKMKLKLDFQKMLMCRTQDILYTLQVAAHIKLKDRQTKKNQNILNSELKKTEKKKAKPVAQIVNRLYGSQTLSKTTLNSEEIERCRLFEFGKRLSEAYQNAMR